AVAAVAMCAGALAFAPVAALTWDVDGSAAPYIGASAALELAYFALLATAYERADLTFVYPIARGAAPVLVLVVSVVALSADVSAGEAAGVLAVAAGVLLVRGVGPAAARGGLALALGVSACIAAYTLVDDEGLRHAAALGYFEAVLLIAAPAYAVAVALTRGPGALRAAMTPLSAVVGIAMFGAYAVALAALEIAEAAPVAALRETSVVMATAAAALFAHERVPPARLVGAVVVVAGIAAIALT
ncbi:MAG TPA: EamA family transporter, partial [Solirubrobacteraceae bacterium]|nr:EamA family transporter [Solirubrobacteraceae bacterium]